MSSTRKLSRLKLKDYAGIYGKPCLRKEVLYHCHQATVVEVEVELVEVWDAVVEEDLVEEVLEVVAVVVCVSVLLVEVPVEVVAVEDEDVTVEELLVAVEEELVLVNVLVVLEDVSVFEVLVAVELVMVTEEVVVEVRLVVTEVTELVAVVEVVDVTLVIVTPVVLSSDMRSWQASRRGVVALGSNSTSQAAAQATTAAIKQGECVKQGQ